MGSACVQTNFLHSFFPRACLAIGIPKAVGALPPSFLLVLGRGHPLSLSLLPGDPTLPPAGALSNGPGGRTAGDLGPVLGVLLPDHSHPSSQPPCSPGSLTVSAQLPLSAVGHLESRAVGARPAADRVPATDPNNGRTRHPRASPASSLCPSATCVVRIRQGH